ncbi:MAG: YciI family protein [Motiliproteus sp.]|nr:YciI family protein [Motiliproteus sp.]MCW9052814.1 YciI family protein [Motiliproteus sp.]
MARFMITYLGGNQPATPEEGKQHFAKYMEWLGSLGDAAVSPANPLKGTRTVQPDGGVAHGSVTGMSGFTVVEVKSIDAAIEIAKACPFLEIGGSLEVSEMIDMPMAK